MEIDRRQSLAAVATLGTGLMLASCARGTGEGGARKGGEKEVSANEDLMREHGVLRRVLILYREVAPKIAAGAPGLDIGAIAAAAGLFRDFGEQYHERQLEEQYIFPALRSGPNHALVETLLAQHQRGREITAFVLDATKGGQIATARAQGLANAMVAFSRMYEAHTAREDTVLFPAFKEALPESRLEELSDRFEDIEHKQFGKDGFEKAVKEVADIEARLGIADLAGFTAPAAR
jgi:hemerythrin-like domain-containing protein